MCIRDRLGALGEVDLGVGVVVAPPHEDDGAGLPGEGPVHPGPERRPRGQAGRARVDEGRGDAAQRQRGAGRDVHGEETGSLHQRLVVDRGGRPLLRTELAVGPRWPASLGPAGTAGGRAVGTVVAVGIELTPVAVPGVRMAVQPLAEGAVLLTALAERPGDLTLALDEASLGGGRGTTAACSSSVSSWP